MEIPMEMRGGVYSERSGVSIGSRASTQDHIIGSKNPSISLTVEEVDDDRGREEEDETDETAQNFPR